MKTLKTIEQIKIELEENKKTIILLKKIIIKENDTYITNLMLKDIKTLEGKNKDLNKDLNKYLEEREEIKEEEKREEEIKTIVKENDHITIGEWGGSITMQELVCIINYSFNYLIADTFKNFNELLGIICENGYITIAKNEDNKLYTPDKNYFNLLDNVECYTSLELDTKDIKELETYYIFHKEEEEEEEEESKRLDKEEEERSELKTKIAELIPFGNSLIIFKEGIKDEYNNNYYYTTPFMTKKEYEKSNYNDYNKIYIINKGLIVDNVEISELKEILKGIKKQKENTKKGNEKKEREREERETAEFFNTLATFLEVNIWSDQRINELITYQRFFYKLIQKKVKVWEKMEKEERERDTKRAELLKYNNLITNTLTNYFRDYNQDFCIDLFKNRIKLEYYNIEFKNFCNSNNILDLYIPLIVSDFAFLKSEEYSTKFEEYIQELFADFKRDKEEKELLSYCNFKHLKKTHDIIAFMEMVKAFNYKNNYRDSIINTFKVFYDLLEDPRSGEEIINIDDVEKLLEYYNVELDDLSKMHRRQIARVI